MSPTIFGVIGPGFLNQVPAIIRCVSATRRRGGFLLLFESLFHPPNGESRFSITERAGRDLHCMPH